MTELLARPALTLATAMFAGVLAQALARRLHVPGIVLLLASGVVLGPDVLGILDPRALGSALQAVVGFGVAVVLFEGGMNQNLVRLRREALPIRRLVTLGAALTAVGAAVAAHLALGWDWRLSTLFGTLVIVTGPTVITPILRRLRLKRSIETVLEAEGVFIDVVGAIVAVAALEFVLHPTPGSLATVVMQICVRMGTGALVGIAAGLIMATALEWTRIIPKGLENIFALSVVILAFEVSNTIIAESGIAAALVAGMLIGNTRIRVAGQLADFKGQLTVLLIAVLFVLLAADVRIADVRALGWPGLMTVAAVMFIVRPLNVFLCTVGTRMSVRDKLFLSWLAPRGIVAAAVASLFAYELAAANIAGGTEVRALVFLVIAATVVVQGLSAKMVAGALGVLRAGPEGTVVLGANALGRCIAHVLERRGEGVVLIDSNQHRIARSRTESLTAVLGNPLQYKTLRRAGVHHARLFAAVTSNEHTNYVVAGEIAAEHSGPALAVALTGSDQGVTPTMLESLGAARLFGRDHDIELWIVRMRRDRVKVESWVWQPAEEEAVLDLASMPTEAILPLVALSEDYTELVTDRTVWRPGLEVDFAMADANRDEAVEWLQQNSWYPADGLQPGDDPRLPVDDHPLGG